MLYSFTWKITHNIPCIIQKAIISIDEYQSFFFFCYVTARLEITKRPIQRPTGEETLRRAYAYYLRSYGDGEEHPARRSETGRINRYRDTASMRKRTGQQLSEGAFSRRDAGGRDRWNAPRTGRKAADIPKFATARGPGKKQLRIGEH